MSIFERLPPNLVYLLSDMSYPSRFGLGTLAGIGLAVGFYLKVQQRRRKHRVSQQTARAVCKTWQGLFQR
jgi:hypothetical protein